MLKLGIDELKQFSVMGIKTPEYDVKKIWENTKKNRYITLRLQWVTPKVVVNNSIN
ncbi:hypothetical protein [Salipaludibacillus neizhouensis]|uniref:hypothetical protein n=1 Tax=Salipaludibacillus neizhouensis TaxID=885475 RepID=UPI0016046756|nr:hypothetical protein [Salipaludibacillus neizhouensis]